MSLALTVLLVALAVIVGAIGGYLLGYAEARRDQWWR